MKTNLSSVALLTNIFFHSMDDLLVLSMLSPAVQKLLSLISPHLFVFCCCFVLFYFHLFRRWLKRDIAVTMPNSILPMFSSKSFIVSSLTFRSLIHFEFIFVCGKRECSNFIILHVVAHFFSAPFIEKTVFSSFHSLDSLVLE